MKNTFNLIAVLALMLVVGCSCPKLREITTKRDSPPPPPPAGKSPSSPNTSSSPSETTTGSSPSLTLDKYNRLKIDMQRAEVEKILGGPGEEISNSTGGGVNFTVNKWSGENYTAVIISFRNNRIMSMSQVGLK